MYQHCDVGLVRAPAYPTGFSEPPWPDLAGSSLEDARGRLRWMRQVWERPEVADAIEAASPSLARQVREAIRGRAVAARHERRTARSLACYLLRLRHRATPFGLFAGIAVVRIGPSLAVAWGDDHQEVARADAAWLADVSAGLEASPELLRRLSVIADPACLVRGDRLTIGCQQASVGREASTPMAVSVRYTPAVRAAVEAAATPVSLGDLAKILAARYPAVATSRIAAMLAELVACRILLTSLRAPMTVTDALAHLNGQLDAVGASEIEDVAPVARALHEIEKALARHSSAGPDARRQLRVSARDRMHVISAAVEQPTPLDVLLDCSMTLPLPVAREAGRAAAALARLTSFPNGTAAWADYRARFLERYGPDALVPVLDLTDPHTGLGFPAGYRGSVIGTPERRPSPRDEQMLSLAQRAALSGTSEVVLSDRLLASLTLRDDLREPPHLDLCFQVHAPSENALSDGDFTVTVVGLTPTAGAQAGRFLDLLAPPDRSRLIACLRALPTLDADATHVQVSSPPLRVGAEIVSRTPMVWPTLISLGEHSGEPAIPLRELAVTADATRFHLIAIQTGQPVEPIVINTVEAATFTHPLARFLCEVPKAHLPVLGAFPWGSARRLPFLPRIRYGRAILAPATWRIEPSYLPAQGDSQPWEQGLAAFRKQAGIPSAVYLGDGDQRLRLELDEPAHCQLLRTSLDRDRGAVLREAPGPGAFGWFGGRAHEITLTFASSRPPDKRRPASQVPRVLVGRDHGDLPGASRWASARLYGPPDGHARLLTRHLPELLARCGHPSCWFVRYADPDHHLRIRFALPFGVAGTQVGTWAAQLRDLGMITRLEWDTYFPEIGRFGAGPLIQAAEQVFAADSAAAITELTATTTGMAHHAVTAASLVDLAVSFTGELAMGCGGWPLLTQSARPRRCRERSTPRRCAWPTQVTASRPCVMRPVARRSPGRGTRVTAPSSLTRRRSNRRPGPPRTRT